MPTLAACGSNQAAEVLTQPVLVDPLAVVGLLPAQLPVFAQFLDQLDSGQLLICCGFENGTNVGQQPDLQRRLAFDLTDRLAASLMRFGRSPPASSAIANNGLKLSAARLNRVGGMLRRRQRLYTGGPFGKLPANMDQIFGLERPGMVRVRGSHPAKRPAAARRSTGSAPRGAPPRSRPKTTQSSIVAHHIALAGLGIGLSAVDPRFGTTVTGVDDRQQAFVLFTQNIVELGQDGVRVLG